jgi:hypothetical protein
VEDFGSGNDVNLKNIEVYRHVYSFLFAPLALAIPPQQPPPRHGIFGNGFRCSDSIQALRCRRLLWLVVRGRHVQAAQA